MKAGILLKKTHILFALLLSLICVTPVFAVAVNTMQEATVVGQTKLYVEGNPIRYVDMDGKRWPVLSYQHTNYVPAQAVGEWSGQTMRWNQSQRTLDFSGGAAKLITAADEIPELSGSVPVNVLSNCTVRMDSKLVSAETTLLLYDGVSYAPVRMAATFNAWEVAVGELGYAYLRAPITKAQAKEMGMYVTRMKALWEDFSKQHYQILTDDVDYYQRELPEFVRILNEIATLSRPECNLFQYAYGVLDESLADMYSRIEKTRVGLADNLPMVQMRDTYWTNREDRPCWDGFIIAPYEMEDVLYQQ